MGLFDRFRKKIDHDKEKNYSSKKNKGFIFKKRNFKYLDDLIHSGAKEIILDDDIITGKDLYFWGINIDVDDISIDGNGFSIDALSKTPIFKITGNNVTLKNINFKNGFAVNGGGCIYNEGDSLIIENCTFENNQADYGGTIYNEGDINIINCNFIKNNGSGGIVLSKGIMNFSNCNIENNHVDNHGLFRGADGFSTFENCKFKGNYITNVQDNSALFYNFSNIKFKNCIFENNFNNDYQEKYSLFNNRGFLFLIHCKFFDILDSSNKLNLVNNNSSLFIKNSNFETKIFNNFVNNGFLDINGCTFDESIKILNQLTGDIYSNDEDIIKNIIVDDGGVFHNHCDYKSFSSLSELINGDSNKIILDGDYIFLPSDEEFLERGIQIDRDDLIIDGNNFSINGVNKSPIFRNYGKNNLIKNVNFINGFTNSDGGAISNRDNLNVENCSFKGNSSHLKSIYDSSSPFGGFGGAISNFGYLTLKNCNFQNNNSNKYGGAIANCIDNSFLICSDSSFKNNSSLNGGAISNKSQVQIVKSEFNGNIADENGSVLFQEEKNSNFVAEYSSFLFNYKINNNIIHIENGFFSDNSSKFIEDNSIDYNSDLIKKHSLIVHDVDSNMDSKFLFYNQDGVINLKDSKFNIYHKKLCYNNNLLKFDLDQSIYEFVELSSNAKLVDLNQNLNQIKYGFEYLENLIRNNDGEVVIDHDILLDYNESPFYEGGIELNEDNLVINGQNHIIDANGLSRVFFVSAKNIVLKNIKFIRGQYFKNFFDNEFCGGGVIYALKDTSLKIYNCDFVENNSSVSSSVIFNDGDSLEIIKSNFVENNSELSFGVIYNNGHLSIQKSNFQKNKAKTSSGVISSFNNEKNCIIDCNFIENECFEGAAVIYNYNNDSSFSYKNCNFRFNISSKEYPYSSSIGNLIVDCGSSLSFENCNFEENNVYIGSLITNNEDDVDLFLKNCNFEDNESKNSIIRVNGKNQRLNIDNSSFINNHSLGRFGVIYFDANDSFLNIKYSFFKSNRSHYSGAVISCVGQNNSISCYNNEFIENIAHLAGAVFYLGPYDCNIYLEKCIFKNNIGKSYNADFYSDYNAMFKFEKCNFDCLESNILNYEAILGLFENRKFFNEKYLFVTNGPNDYSDKIITINCKFDC